MTIDELAHRSSTAASTIRMYQTKGLLPPPTKHGRVGYYGRGLDTVLGLEEQIAAAWGDEEPLILEPEEFAARFAGVEVTPAQIQRSVALGLVRLEDDRIVIPSPRFLEIGSELSALGVPLDASLDEYERLAETTLDVADRFLRLFDEHLWQPVADRGLPADEVARLAEVLKRLSALAEGVVTVTVRPSLKHAAAGFVAAAGVDLDLDVTPRREQVRESPATPTTRRPRRQVR